MTDAQIRNAIQDAVRCVQEYPDDAIDEIFNEAFERWHIPWRMDVNLAIKQDARPDLFGTWPDGKE